MTKLRRNLIMAGVAAALLGTAGAAQAQPWGYYGHSDWRYNPVGAFVASPFIALGAAVSPYHGYYYGPRYGYRTASYDPYFAANAPYRGRTFLRVSAAPRTGIYADPHEGLGATAMSGAYLNAQARYDVESQRTQLYVDPNMGLGRTAPDIDRRIPASELNVIQAEARDHYWGG